MSLLPAGYKRLLYIQSTGSQYIDTGLKMGSNNVKTVSDVQTTSAITNENVYLQFSPEPTATTAAMLQLGIFNSKWRLHFPNVAVTGDAAATTNRSRITFSVIGNTNMWGGDASGTASQENYLSGSYRNKNITIARGSFKHYGYELHINGQLKMVFIPAKNASGTVGMYELIGQKFYGPSSGTYTAGSAIEDTDDAFKQVEYIQSSGTQYVDTGFKPNNNSRIAMIAKYLTAPTANAALFGARNADNNEFWVYYRPADAKFCLRYASGGASDKLVAGTPTAKNVVDMNKNTLYVGNASVSATAASYSSAYTAYLFAVNNANSATLQSAMQVYSTDIYDNGAQIRKYIPYVTALGTPGLMDTVNNVFYSSVTAADFVAGPEIVTEWTLLEYVEFSGAQYVDTTFVPNQNTRVVMDCKANALTDGGVFPFGVRVSTSSQAFNVAVTTSQVFANFYTAYQFADYGNTYERMTIDMNKNVATFTGNSKATIQLANGTFTANGTLVLGNLRQAGAVLGSEFGWNGSVYSCQIYDNGVLLYELKPCHLLDGRVGLVDESTGVFFESASATPLIAGPEAITVPLAPEGLTANVSSGVLTLSWTASENAEGYDVYRNGEYVATTFDTTFTDTINPATAYKYGVTAYNEHGESEMSTVAVPATQRPEQVTDLRAMDAGFNYITLTWDNVAGADAYRVSRNGVLLSEQKETGYSDSGLKTETAYTYGVSAVNEVGESAVVEITVSTTEFKLVTDRTAADVQRALELSKALPSENIEEWLAGMKGSYNVFDLNRVELAVLYVIERLRIAGWYIAVESKTEWKFSDFPTVSEMARYLNNIRKLRSALPKGLPAVPLDMDGFTYNEANDIERLLEMLDAAVSNIMANVFYSDELYSGEVQ